MTDKRVGIDDLLGRDGTAATVESVPTVAYTPVMAEEAFYGLAGRLVRAIEPYTEADPVAILMHLLIGAGNLIGRGPHGRVEMTRHHGNEFAALVGRTSKGRKGQAWSTPRHVFNRVDPEWSTYRVRSGLSSGEGVIYNVRDAREEQQPVKERGRVVDFQRVVVDHGEADKRLLVIEPEMAVVLRRMAGETNSLSSILRDAWDHGSLSTLTKNSPLRATDAHVSIVAHITEEELIAHLTDTERANGFANRFLFMLVRPSKVLPEPEPVPDIVLAPLIAELQEVMRWARGPRLLVRDARAREVWGEVYETLSEGESGLVGAVLGRAEAHALRLSLLYAVLDRSPVITVDHLHAALAVWDYAETSARRIFGDRLGLSVADAILKALRTKGPMTRDEISALFSYNKSSDEISAALALLCSKGLARTWKRPAAGGAGRPAEMWEATPRKEKSSNRVSPVPETGE